MPPILQEVHPVLAAHDVAVSIRFYARLGFTLYFQDVTDDPKYAVVRRDGAELHLQWAAPDQWVAGLDRPVYRFRVDNVDELYVEFARAGGIFANVTPPSPYATPTDTPWGTRELHLCDPAQNGLQFYRLL